MTSRQMFAMRSTPLPAPARSSTRSRSSTDGRYLRWIDATKKRPDVRAERIAEVVRLLEQGQKERP